MLDEAKLRKVALLTVPVCGAFLCLFLLAAALWLFQGREFWATASKTVAGVGTDVHGAVQPIAPLVTSGQKAVDGLTGAVGEVKGLIGVARPVLRHLATTEGGVDTLVARTDDHINRECVPGPCGLLADTAKTLGTYRGTAGQLEIGIHRFNAHEDALFSQEQDFYATAQHSAKSFDAIMSSPDILPLIHNLNTGTATGDHMLYTFDQVETKATQCYLHPTLKCELKGLLVPAVQIGGAAYTAFK